MNDEKSITESIIDLISYILGAGFSGFIVKRSLSFSGVYKDLSLDLEFKYMPFYNKLYLPYFLDKILKQSFKEFMFELDGFYKKNRF